MIRRKIKESEKHAENNSLAMNGKENRRNCKQAKADWNGSNWKKSILKEPLPQKGKCRRSASVSLRYGPEEAILITGAPALRTSGDQHHQSHISSILSSLLLESIEISGWQCLRAATVAQRHMWLNALQLFTPKFQQHENHSPPQAPKWRKKEGEAPPRSLVGKILSPRLQFRHLPRPPKKKPQKSSSD